VVGAFRRSTPSHFSSGGDKAKARRRLARGNAAARIGKTRTQIPTGGVMSANKVMSEAEEEEAAFQQFRTDLTRRINGMVGHRQRLWRSCPQRICRRARTCRAPQIHCSNFPQPPRTDAEIAVMQGTIRRALKLERERWGLE
jgi:hypothetical protein